MAEQRDEAQSTVPRDEAGEQATDAKERFRAALEAKNASARSGSDSPTRGAKASGQASAAHSGKRVFRRKSG